MRTYTVQGIILKRKNIAEADRLLTVFTREQGKMRFLAKGVRKITSKRASHIEPLNIVSLTLYKGNGLPILTEAVVSESFSSVKENLLAVGFAYHICELIDGLCPENQENAKVFFMFSEILHLLSTTTDITKHIHRFEIELLTVLGYWTGDSQAEKLNTAFYIENILERRLKARQIVSRIIS